MARQTQKEERELTRKETIRRRRDVEANRRMTIAVISIGALILVLIAAGIIQEFVIKPGQPVAVVNGEPITSAEYAKRVRFSWLQSGGQVQDPQGSSVQVLDQMVDEKLLLAEAAKRGITVTDEEVTEYLEQSFGYLRNTPTPSPTPSVQPTPGGEPTSTPVPPPTSVSQSDYEQALNDYETTLSDYAGMNEADFRELIRLDLMRSKLYEQVSDEVPTAEEQVHARHILVSIRTPQPTATPLPEGTPAPTPDPAATPTPAPRDETEALARIQEAQEKLEAGEDFATVASEYSDDSSAADGGDLGWFGRERMVPEFGEVAFSLEPGQISEPVKTEFGYHLIEVLEKDPQHPIDEFTLAQDQYTTYTDWLAQLRSEADVVRQWSVDKVPPTPVPPQL